MEYRSISSAFRDNSLKWASQVVLVVKNLPANAGDIRDMNLIPGSGRSPGGGHGNLSSFPGGSNGKESTCNVADLGLTLGWEDPLEKGMATHSIIRAWEIPLTEEPGGLQTIRSQRIGHD